MGFLDDEIARIEAPPRPKEKRSRLPLIALAVLLLGALAILAFIALSFSEDRSVVVIPLEGEILTGDFNTGEYVGSEYIGRALRRAADDPLVVAIVLRVNSPGGSPAGAQEIIEEIEYAKEKKPVVVSMGDLAASAAYQISAHADRIYANPDTLTGSIGTVWTFVDMSGWMDEEGYAVDVVKSGDKKDMTSPYRNRTASELAYAQKVVDESFEYFISDVVHERGVDRALIADGRIVRGEEAVRIGLVDEIGNLFDAVDGARALSNN
ncbi:MAG: signal peptide peptidase SppA [Methanobacteriota archaeon]|nr:MAG: signal peptide peptidase SppA [Euryarchaeota archaeon]